MANMNYSFLSIGKTAQSTEAKEFKRYIGVGSSFVKAVNPDKATLSSLLGYDAQEPEYFGTDEDGKFARITFIVATDPEQCNGIQITERLTFTLHANPAYNRDNTKVQVIDTYGNSSWANVEDAKAGNKLLSSNGKELKIGPKYRMACRGEADLVGFLKTYLVVEDAFNYVNGSWVLKENAENYVFGLDHIKDYFNGDFSELKEALKLQPNNKVKLLYGVRTTDEGKQYQAIASRDTLILRNSANANALVKLDKELQNIKNNGGYPTTEFKVQELQEYNVKATDLSTPQYEDSIDSAMPWN